MNFGKLSGLKALGSHSTGKRRFRGDLTPDMISPPLGDFRHTMHVGRGGDVFGDTSFLSNHGGTGNNADGDSSSISEKNEGFFSRTLRYIRRTPDRPCGDSRELSPPPPPISPIIKNAISLPRLDSPNGCPVKELFPSSPETPENSTYLYGLESGFVTLPRVARTERQVQGHSPPSCPAEIHRVYPTDTGISSFPCSDSFSTSDSMTSFSLDLGPSLMSEVFGMIDSPVCERANPISEMTREARPSFGLTGDEVDSDVTASLVDSLLREDADGRTRLYGGDRKHLETSITGDLMHSHVAEGHGMEPERFQRAADVLACHNCPDEEEEIKV